MGRSTARTSLGTWELVDTQDMTGECGHRARSTESLQACSDSTMVCQDACPSDYNGVTSQHCTSPPVKKTARTTNPFLPGYQAENVQPKTQNQDTLKTHLRNTAKVSTVKDTTSAGITVQPAPSTAVSNNKPMAKVLPQRREIVVNPYPSPDTAHKHQRTGNRSVIRVKATVRNMGPMSSPMELVKKPTMVTDNKALLSDLASQLDHQIGQYYNNAFTLDSCPVSPTIERHLKSMPANFNLVIDEYSKVCGYDASQDETLKRAYHLLEEAHCYYGKLSMEEARSKLKHVAEGTYLLRDSSDPHFLFSLSVKTKRGVTAVRIAYEDGRFTLDCERDMARRMPLFACILELLQFYTQLTKASAKHRNNMCVFLESSGRRDTAVVLSRPLVHSVASLKCLARKTLNGMLTEEQRRKLLLFMPPRIEQFMTDYAYHI